MDAPTAFATDAKSVLHELRTTLAALIEDVGADAALPRDMARRFSLDKTLTWKISRIVGGEDTWSATAHIPGKAGVRTFVDALRRAGASAEAAEAVSRAMDRFDAFVSTHSGDRGTLEIMLGSVSKPLARQRGEAFRKMAFQGNSAIWGVQARTQVSLQFVAPSTSNPDLLDFAVVCGLLEFRRLRPEATWAVAARRQYAEDGRAIGLPSAPIDRTLGPRDIPLLREFCSDPAPVLRTSRGANGRERYELVEGPVGNTGAATCILGWFSPASASRYRTDADPYGENAVHLYTPVETIVLDVYFHRSLKFPPPVGAIYSQVPGGPLYPADGERGRLPMTEEIVDLGNPPDCTITAVPRCAQMAEAAARRIGYPLSEFQGYRVRLRYPPMSSLLILRTSLPERP